MIVYGETKRQFLAHTNDGDIEDIIHAKFIEATGHSVGRNEVRSWRDSLGYMAKVLTDDEYRTTQVWLSSCTYRNLPSVLT